MEIFNEASVLISRSVSVLFIFHLFPHSPVSSSIPQRREKLLPSISSKPLRIETLSRRALLVAGQDRLVLSLPLRFHYDTLGILLAMKKLEKKKTPKFKESDSEVLNRVFYQGLNRKWPTLSVSDRGHSRRELL